MALAAGTRLGPYEIVSALGAGGMGEVYRARDIRLERTVAVKVLNSALIASADLKARFEREARAISQLNHPHICILHDVGHDNGTDFLVMEYIEGETLADRLRRGPLPMDQLLTIAVQIADALDKAHRAGIIHRDLKPGNVMLAKTGAKLLDFGLAKPLTALASAAGSGSGAPSFTAAPTLSGPSPLVSPLTSQGSIVGTIHYMSPEQIEGKEADTRSDIFAFGAVLYEMATAKAAFAGKSQLKVASAILEDEPADVAAQRADVPAPLEHVIRTCLAKDPEQRYQSALDVGLELKWIAGLRSAPKSATRRSYVVLAVGLALALLVALGAAGYFAFRERPSRQVVRASIMPPPKSSFIMIGPYSGFATVSPDGSRVVFAARRPDGQQALWIRPLNAFSEQLLTGTENGSFPFWSPDSRYVAFFADGKLKKVDVNGGPTETIADAVQGRGGTWNAEGVIVFAAGPTGPLRKVTAAGGQPSDATKLAPGQNGHRLPYFLPDNKHFLFFSSGGAGVMSVAGGTASGAIYVASLDDDLPGEGKLVIKSDWNAQYSPPGYLLFLRDNTLLAAPFSMRRLEVTGPSLPVAQGVSANSGVFQALFSVSNNGVLAYVAGAAMTGGWHMIWYDRAGKQVERLGAPAMYFAPQLSRDQSRVIFHLREPSGNTDIWTYDLKRKVPSRFTFDAGVEINPIWSPDGSMVYYSTNRKHGIFSIVRKPANGVGAEEEVFVDQNSDCRPHAVTADGKYLVFGRLDARERGNWEIWALPLDRKAEPFVVVKNPFGNVFSQVSPDGKWLAYASNETGMYQVYVTPFPAGNAKWQVSNASGLQPRWRRDGKELFYFNAGKVYSVSIDTAGGNFQAGVPHELFNAITYGFPSWLYDVSADGKRFLFTSGDVTDSTEPISLVVNWPALLIKQ